MHPDERWGSLIWILCCGCGADSFPLVGAMGCGVTDQDQSGGKIPQRGAMRFGDYGMWTSDGCENHPDLWRDRMPRPVAQDNKFSRGQALIWGGSPNLPPLWSGHNGGFWDAWRHWPLKTGFDPA